MGKVLTLALVTRVLGDSFTSDHKILMLYSVRSGHLARPGIATMGSHLLNILGTPVSAGGDGAAGFGYIPGNHAEGDWL